MKCGGGGVVEHFFNAVQLTIIPQWIFLSLILLSMTLIWFPTQQDTNDLTKTKMALGGFCWSIFNFKQMAATSRKHCRTDGQRSLRIWRVQAEDAAVRTSHKVQVILAVAPSRSSCSSFIQVNHITPLITDWLLLLNPIPIRLTCTSYQPSTKWIGWIKITHA